jgi:hypothetical protein
MYNNFDEDLPVKLPPITELISEILSYREQDRRYYDTEYHAYTIAEMCVDLKIDEILRNVPQTRQLSELQSELSS